MNFDFENGCENDFKNYNENHAADPGLGFHPKSILKPYGRATTIPLAWELTKIACK